jgi:hypothetical protein
MFRIPFRSQLSDFDLKHLESDLGMITDIHPKLHNSPVSPGVVRLDFQSGMFLVPGELQNEWVIEGRTWGDPPQSVIDGWRVHALLAAHHVDPTVTLPPHPHAPPDSPLRPAKRRRFWHRHPREEH